MSGNPLTKRRALVACLMASVLAGVASAAACSPYCTGDLNDLEGCEYAGYGVTITGPEGTHIDEGVYRLEIEVDGKMRDYAFEVIGTSFEWVTEDGNLPGARTLDFGSDIEAYADPGPGPSLELHFERTVCFRKRRQGTYAPKETHVDVYRDDQIVGGSDYHSPPVPYDRVNDDKCITHPCSGHSTSIELVPPY